MPQYLDIDQITYIHNINQTIRQRRIPIIHPHHFHYEVSGQFFHEWVEKTLGSMGFTDIIFNLRLWSLVFTCMGLFFGVLFLKEITGKLFWGIAGTLLISFTHGFLLYSCKVDSGIFPASWLLFLLWLFNRIQNARKHVLFLFLFAGIALFLGIMFHQVMGIECVSFSLSMLIPSFIFFQKTKHPVFSIQKKECSPQVHQNPVLKFKGCFLMIFTTGVLLFITYFYVTLSLYNLPVDKADPGQGRGWYKDKTLTRWIFLHETDERFGWGTGLKRFNPILSFVGFTDAFLTQKNMREKYHTHYALNYKPGEPFHKDHYAHNHLCFFFLFVCAGLIILFPLVVKRYRRTIFFILFSLLFHIIFSTYWEAKYLEHWLTTAILIIVTGILLLNTIGEKLSFIFRKFSQFPFYTYILILLVCIASYNIHYHVKPYSRNRIMDSWGIPEREKELRSFFHLSIYKYPDNPYKMIDE